MQSIAAILLDMKHFLLSTTLSLKQQQNDSFKRRLLRKTTVVQWERADAPWTSMRLENHRARNHKATIGWLPFQLQPLLLMTALNDVRQNQTLKPCYTFIRIHQLLGDTPLVLSVTSIPSRLYQKNQR